MVKFQILENIIIHTNGNEEEVDDRLNSGPISYHPARIIRIFSSTNTEKINLLKPNGYVMHQQFNIQQLYVLPTLYLCVLYLSENKQWLVPLTA